MLYLLFPIDCFLAKHTFVEREFSLWPLLPKRSFVNNFTQESRELEFYSSFIICAFSFINFEVFLGVAAEKFEYLGIGWVDFDSKTRFRKVIKFY